MSRTGVEPKPPWRSVPRDVRRASEELLGADVRRAMRVWGGYSPTPTYRLRLADGRSAFLKAVGPDSNAFSRVAHGREEQVYRELGTIIEPWAPRFYGAFELDEWQVILLEDLGPKSVPPWKPALARDVSRAFGDFHRTTLGVPLPSWLPGPERQLPGLARLWDKILESDDLRAVASLAGGRAIDALSWLELAAPRLAAAGRSLAEAGPPYAFLHRDLRSDNLRWTNGRLRMFDWPHVGAGPTECDLVEFAQSVTVDGGPEPEQIVDWYAERAPVRPHVLDASIAAIAAFFADQSWRAEIPGLPRLRSFQRQQLRVTLAWGARRLRLPSPPFIP